MCVVVKREVCKHILLLGISFFSMVFIKEIRKWINILQNRIKRQSNMSNKVANMHVERLLSRIMGAIPQIHPLAERLLVAGSLQ